MDIYILRHGETVWNYKGITQGRSNNRLSKNGVQQVENTALKCKDIAFDEIFVSPLMRTMQTANIINKYHNKKLIKDERIIEINQGIFSGRHKDSLTKEEQVIKNSRDPKYGLETNEMVYERVSAFLKDVSEKYKGKTILVITHRCIAKTLYCLINKIDVNSNINENAFENAEVKHCKYCE